MSKEVGWLLEVHVEFGKREALVELIREHSEWIEQNEPGTMRYEWWISADGTTGQSYERFSDSDAALAHLETYKKGYAKRFWSLVGTLRLSVYGEPSQELIQALTDGMPVQFERIGGFVRSML